jgi:hypothetical protein
MVSGTKKIVAAVGLCTALNFLATQAKTHDAVRTTLGELLKRLGASHSPLWLRIHDQAYLSQCTWWTSWSVPGASRTFSTCGGQSRARGGSCV